LKIVYTILLSLFLLSSSYGQFKKLQVTIDILPELKSLLQNQEVSMVLMQDSNRYANLKIPGTIILDSLTKDSFYIAIDCLAKAAGFEKYLRLSITTGLLEKDPVTKLYISFPEDCAFNKNAFNNKCPKCKRTDKVIPIIYGLESIVADSAGNIVNDHHKHYHGGCMVSNCAPTWYCQRDKLSF
jgi:hypothetical protein